MSTAMNARQAKLQASITEIEDVFVEYLRDIYPETRNTAEVSKDLNLDYHLAHGILRYNPRFVDLNPHGRRRAWTSK